MEKEKKNDAVICNIGHSFHETDIYGLKTYPKIRKIRVQIVNSLNNSYVFFLTNNIFVLVEDQNRLLNPGFSLTNHSIAQMKLWNQRMSDRYEKQVYMFCRNTLIRSWSDFTLPCLMEKLSGKLTELMPSQADYMGVATEDPYK